MKVQTKQFLQRRDVRGWAIVGIVLALLVGLGFVGSAKTSVPYDLDSTKPDGTKAFQMLVEKTGARVERDSYPHGDVAVLLVDTLTQRESDQLQDWVSRGGTLIVADVASSFQQGVVADSLMSVPTKLSAACDANFVNGVSKISPHRKAAEDFFESDKAAAVQCFPGSSKAYYLQADVAGQGRIIELGGADIFTNDRLDKDDNSVLVMNLLRPSAKSAITILETRDTSSASAAKDQAGLGDLINRRVKDGLWTLIAAGVIYMLWRARRLGAPIEEEPLVQIPASQLVLATGGLLELANQPAAAAAMIRNDFRRSLANRFGFSPNLDAVAITQLVSDRVGVDPKRLFAVLREDAVISSENLVAYAQHVELLHQEVKRVR